MQELVLLPIKIITWQAGFERKGCVVARIGVYGKMSVMAKMFISPLKRANYFSCIGVKQ